MANAGTATDSNRVNATELSTTCRRVPAIEGYIPLDSKTGVTDTLCLVVYRRDGRSIAFIPLETRRKSDSPVAKSSHDR